MPVILSRPKMKIKKVRSGLLDDVIGKSGVPADIGQVIPLFTRSHMTPGTG
jgi:hypothetical protein